MVIRQKLLVLAGVVSVGLGGALFTSHQEGAVTPSGELAATDVVGSGVEPTNPESAVQVLAVSTVSATEPTAADQPAPAVAVLQVQDTVRAKYPSQWEVPTRAGSRLDSLRRVLDREITLLPARDLEDQTPLPIWFRVYLRKQQPDLPTDGPYQYPRTASRLLQWLVANPDSVGDV